MGATTVHLENSPAKRVNLLLLLAVYTYSINIRMPYLLRDCGASTWPYERVQLQPNAVSTAELFGLVAQVKPETACSYLTKLAGRRDPLQVLRHTSKLELQQLPMTEKQAARILAAVELGRRIFGSQSVAKKICDPNDAANALSYDLSFQPKERFAVLVLDAIHNLICVEIISMGTATETLAHPREVFAAVFKANGIRCIVAHNHPSGSVQPSPGDLDLTRNLLAAGQVVEVPVLDHLILGQGQFCSLRETTTLWDEFPQPE